MPFVNNGTIAVDLDEVVAATGVPTWGLYGSDGAAFVTTDLGGSYVFARADGAVSQGAICSLASDGDAAELDTAGSGTTNTVVGVARQALADNEFGWFWRGGGSEEVLLAAGVNANTQVTTTATAGEGGTGGDNIYNLFTDESSGAGGLTSCRCSGLLSTNFTVAVS